MYIYTFDVSSLAEIQYLHIEPSEKSFQLNEFLQAELKQTLS